MSKRARYQLLATLYVVVVATASTAESGASACGYECKDDTKCAGLCEADYHTVGHETDGCRIGSTGCLCIDPMTLEFSFTIERFCDGYTCSIACPNPPCPFLTGGDAEAAAAAAHVTADDSQASDDSP